MGLEELGLLIPLLPEQLPGPVTRSQGGCKGKGNDAKSAIFVYPENPTKHHHLEGATPNLLHLLNCK